MKNIFISYGHDEYATLADMLYERLTEMKDENGEPEYTVFKDDKGAIRDARMWDRELEEALSSSDFIIFLMSEHSVRPDSVCLDEIAYARNKGGINIIPLRVGNVTAPLLICRLQWIEWLDQPEKFDNIFERILAGITDYDSVMQNNGQGIVFNRLFKSDFYSGYEDIIGRENEIEECKEFIFGDNVGPLIIKGVAGSGKSGLTGELSKDRMAVRSIHRCRFEEQTTKSIHNIFCNLAYFLSCNDKEYQNAIVRENLDKVDEWSDEILFEKLFINPLKNYQEKFALIIDGIDEMDGSEGIRLIDIVRNGANRIPNVKFILSLRSERKYSTPCAGLPSVELTTEKNIPAAKKMLEAELKKRNIYSVKTVEKILDASEGNFLYITVLLQDLDSNSLNIDENFEFPKGLKQQYLQSMRRFFGDVDKYYDEYAPVIGVLCVAKRPLSQEELAILTGISPVKLNRIILGLRYVIKHEAQKISIYHKSMKEFLCSYDSDEYMIDVAEADKTIVSNAKAMSLRNIKGCGYLNDYLFCHIFRSTDSEYADSLYSQDKEWSENCGANSVSVLSSNELQRLANTANEMENGYSFIKSVFNIICRMRLLSIAENLNESLKEEKKYQIRYIINRGRICYLRDEYDKAIVYFGKAVEISEKAGTETEISASYSYLADIALKKDNIDEAERLYTLALEIDKRNAEEFPSYESRRDLSISYNRLADIALKKDNIDEAERLYTLALEIDKRNAEEFPSYESRRGLSISYNDLAGIAIKKDNIDEAERLYTLAFEIDKRNAEEFPSYESRRDLSISYGRLSDIALKKDNIDESERLYTLAFEIDKRNAEEFPSYESRRDLSISYGRLSDIALKKDNIDEAERLYTLVLEIAKRNADEFPSYESRRGLSISYNRLADIALKKDNIDEAERLYTLAFEIDKRNADEFPSYESRRDLSISYDRLAGIALKKDNIDEAERLYTLVLEIAKRNADEFPSYESRRGLSISYNRLADIALKKDNTDEAERLYTLAFEIYKRNAEEFPSYESRRDLSISYNRLADIAFKKDNIDEEERLYTLAFEIDKRNAEEFPSYESRRGLSISYNDLADIAFKKDNIDEAERLYTLALEIDKRNAEEFPSYESRRDLIVSYFNLYLVYLTKGDQPSAKKILLLALELAKENYGCFPCEDSKNLLDLVSKLLSY